MLENYNEIWDKISKVIKKEFGCEPVYNDKYLNTKIYSKNQHIQNQNFHDNKEPKEDTQYICLPVILIDWVFRAGKIYDAQVGACQYVAKEKKDINTFDINIL